MFVETVSNIKMKQFLSQIDFEEKKVRTTYSNLQWYNYMEAKRKKYGDA